MIDLTAVVKVNEAHIAEKQSNIESLEAELVGVRDDLKSAESQIVELESTNQLLKDEYQALQLALNSAETKLREIQRENEVLVQQLMSLKAQDADRMNFENDMFLKRQQQIMQLELAEAAKEFDVRKAEDEKELHRLSAAIADAQRIKNMERSSRDAAVRQHTLATAQRKAERIMRTTAAGYREVFKGSGLEFDQDVETPEEEEGQATPPDVAAETPQPSACRSERSASNDSPG